MRGPFVNFRPEINATFFISNKLFFPIIAVKNGLFKEPEYYNKYSIWQITPKEKISQSSLYP